MYCCPNGVQREKDRDGEIIAQSRETNLVIVCSSRALARGKGGDRWRGPFFLTALSRVHWLVFMVNKRTDFKQLLDEVFVISGIIKVGCAK